MSLGKIILLSMVLGTVVGLLAGALIGPGGAAAMVGAGTAFASVIAAGLIQPVPSRRRDVD